MRARTDVGRVLCVEQVLEYDVFMPTSVAIAKGSEWDLMTADEFLDWLQPGVFADLIDGERFMHSPVNLKHAKLIDFVRTLLKLYTESRLGGIVLSEVWAVRLSSRNVFMPDVCWFDAKQEAGLNPTHSPFAPVLAVEALSPTTADRDVGPKFAAYEEHGVQEYWILDPHDLEHRFYARDGEILVEFGRGDSRIESRYVPGFWVDRAWLDPENLPPVLECLQTLLAAS